MKKEINVSNKYWQDDNIWIRLKDKISGTYINKNIEKEIKNIKIISGGH